MLPTLAAPASRLLFALVVTADVGISCPYHQDAVAIAARTVTGDDRAPGTRRPGKDPLPCLAYPENVRRGERDGTVLVMCQIREGT